MLNNVFVMRSGRKLEVLGYGDDAGHPVFFFHGLIGSHHQASYISDQARQKGLRIIAPNRPGVGISEFTERKSPLDAVGDVEDLAEALELDEFSLIGLSGGAPYALATLHRLARRVRTVTVISGLGPMRLAGALRGMDRRRRHGPRGRFPLPTPGEAGIPKGVGPFPSRPGSIPRPSHRHMVSPRPKGVPAEIDLRPVHQGPPSGVHGRERARRASRENWRSTRITDSLWVTCRSTSGSPCGRDSPTTSFHR